jgi:chromate transport protein ChrA
MVGLRAAGTPGLLVAIIGIALPGLVLTIAAYSLLVQYRGHDLVRRGLMAMQYAAAALLASSALRIMHSASGGQFHVVGAALVLGLFLAAYVMQLGAVLVLILAAAIGLLIL